MLAGPKFKIGVDEGVRCFEFQSTINVDLHKFDQTLIVGVGQEVEVAGLTGGWHAYFYCPNGWIGVAKRRSRGTVEPNIEMIEVDKRQIYAAVAVEVSPQHVGVRNGHSKTLSDGV